MGLEVHAGSKGDEMGEGVGEGDETVGEAGNGEGVEISTGRAHPARITSITKREKKARITHHPRSTVYGPSSTIRRPPSSLSSPIHSTIVASP